MEKPNLFQVFIPFDHDLICKGVNEALENIFPSHYLDPKWQEGQTPESVREKLLAEVPIVKSIHKDSLLFFYSFFPERSDAFKFFFDLVSQCLVPDKRLNVILTYAVDLRFPTLGDDLFTLNEVVVKLEDPEERELLQRNFALMETEAKLGLESKHYARKILESRGVLPDLKTSIIQKKMASYLEKLPAFFSADIFTETQAILALCDEDFKRERSVEHISRLIAVQYFFRKLLSDWVKKFPGKRHVRIKTLHSAGKNVLCLVIGLNFLRGREVFEQGHLIRAIQKYIPTAEAIEKTFFTSKRSANEITTAYIEIQKEDCTRFLKEEIGKLKTHLIKDLEHHIAQAFPPIFMPRNEEEVMRNILSLSQQIKYLRDIPQGYITFQEQTELNLFFTVILVRVFKTGMASIADMIKESNSYLQYLPDRIRVVGFLRQTYQKEATVFRLKLPKEGFLRGDHSINLYKARQAVVNELTRCVGEFRDFNGGMIAKQNELLTEVKALFAKEAIKYNEIYIEDFFYSLAPVIMRTLETHAFKSLFQLLLESLEQGVLPGKNVSIQWREENHFTYVTTLGFDWGPLDQISRVLSKSHVGPELAFGQVKTSAYACKGYVFRSPDLKKQAEFRAAVKSLIN